MTLAKRVIPCLDVDAGRVVKGTRFVELRDAGDPAELAARYGREGADELVFLDITATVQSREATFDVISRTAERSQLSSRRKTAALCGDTSAPRAAFER